MSRIYHVAKLLSPPKVGKEYYVPCAEYGGFYVPVIGPVHTDDDLGQPKRHWHVDLRFATDHELSEVVETPLKDCLPPVDYYSPRKFRFPIIVATRGQDVRTQVRKCLRDLPDYRNTCLLRDGSTYHYHTGPSIASHGRMEDSVEGKKLEGRCLACPHRKLPLAAMTPVKGIITCPGHGLMWDATTHTLVRATRKSGDGYSYRDSKP